MPQVQRRSVEGDRPGGAKKSTLATIQAMERAREERRQQMEARKDRKEREKLSNAEKGVVGDVDFVRMISAWREANKDQSKPHATFSTNEAEKNAGGAICICVRKRPISRREVSNKDHDAVSCVHRSVVVHDCRLRVDGISKYLNNQQFAFDHAFSENEDTAEIYRCVSRRPAVLRCLHAIDARRLRETRSWVVSFSILRQFGPSRETAMLRAGASADLSSNS